MAKNKKPVTVQSVIKNLLNEGPLVGFYFVLAINFFKESIDKMTDEELKEYGAGLIHPDRIRQNVSTMHYRLNNFDRT